MAGQNVGPSDDAGGPKMLFSLVIVLLWAVGSLVWFLLPNARADVYDFLIVKMTRVWYKAVLERCAGGARVLDVGIGTATALVKNKEILERKNIVVVGIDYEQAYITKAGKVVSDAGLANRVKLNCTSIYNPKLRSLFVAGEARLDPAQPDRAYGEQEARDAFRRVAMQHGWKV